VQTHFTHFRAKVRKNPALEGADIVVNKHKWTEEEHRLFVEAVRKYHKQHELISQYVGTKTYSQVKNYGIYFKSKY